MAYRSIASTEDDAESPVTEQLTKAWTNNLLAALDGTSTAPKIQTAAIQDLAITPGKLDGKYEFEIIFPTPIVITSATYVPVLLRGLLQADFNTATHANSIYLYIPAGASTITYYAMAKVTGGVGDVRIVPLSGTGNTASSYTFAATALYLPFANGTIDIAADSGDLAYEIEARISASATLTIIGLRGYIT